jgi:hypothetical protein
VPLPPIAVEVAPPVQKQEFVQMLLDACSRVASPVECVAADAPGTGGVSALAIVVWLPRGEGVRIQVGARRGEQRGDWVSRRITFEASDEERERWTTAGFVVGTLASRFLSDAGEAVAEEEEEASAPIEEEPAPAPLEPVMAVPLSPSTQARARRRAWTDAAGLAGPLLDRGPWRFGGMLGMAYQREPWPVFMHVAGRLSWRPKDSHRASMRLQEFDLGAGLPATGGPDWMLDATLAVAFERLHAMLDRPELDPQDRTHWVVGFRTRLELSWMASPDIGAVAGGGLAFWAHNTGFTYREPGGSLGEQSVLIGEQQSIVGELSLGVRLLLDRY